jgi:DNA-binding PadR family transcriptional regulator
VALSALLVEAGGEGTHVDEATKRLYYLISMTKVDNISRRFFRGFIQVHILHHASIEPIYGLALIEELARHGYRLSPGTLYPILHSLEAAGYLRQRRRNVAGKVRKEYTISAAGRTVLRDARGKIRELVEEVLSGEGGGRAAFKP